MTTKRRIGVVLLTVGAGAGCDPPPRSPPTPVCTSTPQGCPDADVAPADVPATDVAFDASFDDAWPDAAVIEAGTPAEAGIDPSVVVDPCAAGSIVDLATAGARDGNVTRYTGDNRGIAAGSDVGWVCGPTDSPVFHRYVPRTSGRLSVDVQRAGTASGLPPFLMVADGCGTLGYGGPDVFACVNPAVYQALGLFPRAALSVTAGVPLYLVVAGARGTYALTITEATVVGAGATCDRAGVTWACAAGLSCSSTEPPRCVADGTLGGACREGPPDCDTGLRCASGHCLTPSTGPGCFPTCPPGSSCAWDGVAERCVPYGTNGGDCRPGASPCDEGLACSAISHRCRPTAALGAACDGSGATSACAAGADCVSGVCAVVGVSGARCRPSGGPTACDAGLICDESCAGCAGGRCVPRTAAGGACVSSSTCAAGTTCATSGGASTCAADGTATGALCRRSLTGPLCDAGLTCGDRNRCAPTLAAGAPCGGSIEGACIAGTGCQRAGASDGGIAPDRDGATQARCLPAPYAESTAPAGEYIDACDAGRSEPFYSRDVIDNRTLRPLSLPFAFRYYGRAQTLFWPGTGAWGSFGANRPAVSDVRFVQPPNGADLVQPFGAHTSPTAGSVNPSVWLQASGSRICSATVGAAPDRRFAVEWNDLTIGDAGTAAHLTFEVVLHETTQVIDFLYRRLEYTPGADLEVDVGLVGGWDDPRTIHRGPVSTAAGVRFTPR